MSYQILLVPRPNPREAHTGWWRVLLRRQRDGNVSYGWVTEQEALLYSIAPACALPEGFPTKTSVPSTTPLPSLEKLTQERIAKYTKEIPDLTKLPLVPRAWEWHRLAGSSYQELERRAPHLLLSPQVCTQVKLVLVMGTLKHKDHTHWLVLLDKYPGVDSTKYVLIAWITEVMALRLADGGHRVRYVLGAVGPRQMRNGAVWRRWWGRGFERVDKDVNGVGGGWCMEEVLKNV